MATTHYPSFDVLNEKEAWDDRTRSIVMKRVRKQKTLSLKSLNPTEAAMLQQISAHLLYENRDDLIDFVVMHIDNKVSERFGESQRKVNVPSEDQLVRSGLKALDDAAKTRFQVRFLDCDTDQQFELIRDLQQGKLESVGLMQDFPQKELFKKLLGLATQAYASHPTVWSEMGYAGPAYPRGYYRIEQGLLDPWEPRQSTSDPKRPDPQRNGERNGSLG